MNESLYTIQYNTIQYNTLQYNTKQIQNNKIQYNKIQYNSIQKKYGKNTTFWTQSLSEKGDDEKNPGKSKVSHFCKNTIQYNYLVQKKLYGYQWCRMCQQWCSPPCQTLWLCRHHWQRASVPEDLTRLWDFRRSSFRILRSGFRNPYPCCWSCCRHSNL